MPNTFQTFLHHGQNLTSNTHFVGSSTLSPQVFGVPNVLERMAIKHLGLVALFRVGKLRRGIVRTGRRDARANKEKRQCELDLTV